MEEEKVGSKGGGFYQLGIELSGDVRGKGRYGSFPVVVSEKLKANEIKARQRWSKAALGQLLNRDKQVRARHVCVRLHVVEGKYNKKKCKIITQKRDHIKKSSHAEWRNLCLNAQTIEVTGDSFSPHSFEP